MTGSSNLCFNILQNEEFGRYAVASKNLEPGDLILSELPFTYGPKSDSLPLCLGCHCLLKCLNVCSTCKWPVCSKICEKLSIHEENECKIFSAVKITFKSVQDLSVHCPQYECITPLRVLLEKERNPEKWEADLHNLEAHTEKRKKTQMWEVEAVNIVGFLHKVCKLQERFPEELIHFVCGILEINSYSIPTPFQTGVMGLYPMASLISHSCVPNAYQIVFNKSEDGTIIHRFYIRASVKIAKGEKIFLNYTPDFIPTLVRRSLLRKGKYFDCCCRRCEDPTELGTNISTLKCKKCRTGDVKSSKPLDNAAVWKCEKCNFSTSGEQIESFLNNIHAEMTDLLEKENVGPSSFEDFIKKYRLALHRNHGFLLSIKWSLCQLYGNFDGYFLKYMPDILLKKKINICNTLIKIGNIISPGLRRQRAWDLYELHSPEIVLVKRELMRCEISEAQIIVKLKEVVKYLEEIVLILSYEHPESQSGKLRQVAIRSLSEVKCYILEFSNHQHH